MYRVERGNKYRSGASNGKELGKVNGSWVHVECIGIVYVEAWMSRIRFARYIILHVLFRF